jgi:adenylate cyclase
MEIAGIRQQFRAAVHVGTVSYGNVGGGNRLDFTAIGPAVNLTARLLGVASLAGEDFVCSARAARALPGASSLGEFTLKGMPVAQEVFALPDGIDHG